MHGGRSLVTGSAAALSVGAMLLPGCGGKDPGEVVVTGRAIAVTDNPGSPRFHTVGLFKQESLVASADVREDGTFSIRARRTDEMEKAQSNSGYVSFSVRGWFLAGGGTCHSDLPLSVRFENGRWLEAGTGEPARLVFEGVGYCEKLQLPFSLP